MKLIDFFTHFMSHQYGLKDDYSFSITTNGKEVIATVKYLKPHNEDFKDLIVTIPYKSNYDYIEKCWNKILKYIRDVE